MLYLPMRVEVAAEWVGVVGEGGGGGGGRLAARCVAVEGLGGAALGQVPGSRGGRLVAAGLARPDEEVLALVAARGVGEREVVVVGCLEGNKVRMGGF